MATERLGYAELTQPPGFPDLSFRRKAEGIWRKMGAEVSQFDKFAGISAILAGFVLNSVWNLWIGVELLRGE